MTDTIKIDVWSDIACPWCYIGKRNLEKGLRRGIRRRGRARSRGDVPLVRALARHSGRLRGRRVGLPRAAQGHLRRAGSADAGAVTGVAAERGPGVPLRLLKHTNTVKAHELLHFAKEQGRQTETDRAPHVRLLHRGPAPGPRRRARRAGGRRRSRRGCRARAPSRAGASCRPCSADQAQATAYGITGVPFFVIDGKYGVSGAQPAEAFSQIVRQVWGERREAVAANA